MATSVADDLPEEIVADRARLLQVLQNLMSNSIKFTTEGGAVSIAASRVPYNVEDWLRWTAMPLFSAQQGPALGRDLSLRSAMSQVSAARSVASIAVLGGCGDRNNTTRRTNVSEFGAAQAQAQVAASAPSEAGDARWGADDAAAGAASDQQHDPRRSQQLNRASARRAARQQPARAAATPAAVARMLEPWAPPYALEISVTDSGIGLPADKVNIIFDAFTQIDNRVTREFGGTGLGAFVL